MYEKLLSYLKGKPPLYAPSTAPFWDDEHISKQMLAAHLSDDTDAASRRCATINASVEWIASLFPPTKGHTKLLDLGCGPGLYAERFARAGYGVTGVDLSRRSIAYARESAAKNGLTIDYQCTNYLDISFDGQFDVVTLIYCDFGVLSPGDRAKLLSLIKKALKPGGALILDGWSPRYLSHYAEGRAYSYQESGFWSDRPHACLESQILYPDTNNYLDQYIVITADKCEQINTWNQIFTEDSLRRELQSAGFSAAFYDDVTGKPWTDTAETICAVARL